jgi:hypothetical protein
MKVNVVAPKKENSWSGSVVLFFPLSQLSKLCGSLKLNIKKLVLALLTENVSEFRDNLSNLLYFDFLKFIN